MRLAETDRRDLFLCHAWDDRAGAALEFYNLLTGLDVKGLIRVEVGVRVLGAVVRWVGSGPSGWEATKLTRTGRPRRVRAYGLHCCVLP